MTYLVDFKDGADILTMPITQTCNLSIKFSHFPIVSKIIEKVIHDQTTSYLTENNVLYRKQSGFRKNHSTDTSLALLADKILTGFDSGLLTGMILIDLQKAFDTINHDILLKKCLLLDFLIVQ